VNRKHFILPILLAAVVSSTAGAATVPGVRYEAELAETQSGATVFNDSLASGGQAVHLGSTGRIEWQVVLPQAGRY
jgi:hypothetical protein